MRLLNAILLLFLFVAGATAHAGWVEDHNGKTIIHIKIPTEIMPDPSRSDTASRAEVAASKLFKKRFPEVFAQKYRDKYKADPKKYGNYNWDDVEIQLEKFSGIKVEGVEVDLLAIAGGLAPDILYINFRKSDNYIQNRFLYPLDEYMQEMTREAIDFRINPKLWPVIDRKGPDGENHIWAIPYGGALGKVLLFRKDLFDEYGVSYPTNEWTWDDMYEAAKKITDPDKGTYGLLFGRGKHESWHWITFLWSAGGEVMTYDKSKDEWKCIFDTREAAKALDFYIKLSAEKWLDEDGTIRRGYAAKDASEINTAWERGQIAMKLDYIDEKVFSSINPEVTGMVPVPLGVPDKNGKRMRGGELNSRMMGLFSKIGNPVVRDAAWEYMSFFDCKEAVETKTRVLVQGGMGRFVNPKYLDMFGYQEIKRLAPKGWADTFEIAIATGKPEPYGRNSNYAYDLMTIPIHRAEEKARNDELPDDEEKRLDILQGMLQEACADANEEMIGIVSPKERTTRRIVAIIVLTILIISFGFMFRNIFKAFSPPADEIGEKKKWGFKKYSWAYILLLPAALSIFMWHYIPLMRGSYMAFFDYRLLGGSTWVGVDNFGDLLFNIKWWLSVWNAIRYSFFVLFLTFLPPIILAILLQEIPKCKLIFRILYYLPAVITGLVVVLLWKQFFDSSSQGMLNAVIMKIPAIGFVGLGLFMLIVMLMFVQRLMFYSHVLLALLFAAVGVMLLVTCIGIAKPILAPAGITESIGAMLGNVPGRLFNTMPEPYNWLGDSGTAMLSCVIPMVWAGMGPGCLIYLAALKGIPDDYYEAADIDGATFIDKIMFVIFPMLKALIIINFVGAFINSWYAATANILVMTGGGPANTTETAGLHIWFKAFTFLKFGPATAMAWMLGFMLIGFTVHQLKILSKVEFKTADKK